jgi:hypothetical protein
VGRQKTAGKSKLGGYVIDGRMTLEEAQACLARKRAPREARKAEKAYSSAQDEVRAMRQEFVVKGVFVRDLPSELSSAELAYAAALARTRVQHAMVTKSAKRTPPSGPSQLEVLDKAASDWHQASAMLSSPPVVTKQLSGPEQRMVADLKARVRVADDPCKREALNDQIARITGLSPAGNV